MTKPADHLESLRVGSISRVNSNRFQAELDPEAPDGTALNTGRPQRFPSVNSYVLIPTGTSRIAGLVTDVFVEQAAFPKREGYEEFGVVDLPFPARHLEVIPVGTIEYEDDRPEFERGVHDLPTVGDPILIPRKEEAECLVEMKEGNVSIGTAPHLDGTAVSLDPDRLFGRHTAVLGNTGSGKSCTVTKIIRECVKSSEGEGAKDEGAVRFIVLDPNGEYSDALEDFSFASTYSVDPSDEDDNEPLELPAWMFNGLEWTAFARAKPDTQRPVLLEALQILRSGESARQLSNEEQLSRDLTAFGTLLSSFSTNPEDLLNDFGTQQTVVTIFEDVQIRCDEFLDSSADHSVADQVLENLCSLSKLAGELFEKFTYVQNGQRRAQSIRTSAVERILNGLRATCGGLPRVSSTPTKGEDRPVKFPVRDLPSTVQRVASRKGSAKYVRPMQERIRSMFSLERTRKLLDPDDDISFQGWLEQFFGADSGSSKVSIIDLSLVPEDVVHLATAVLARLIFETLQRFRMNERELLPTTLVVDEAHNFMAWQPRGKDGEEYEPQTVCRNAFQRVAKEGRKFGLGLLVASQRPAELDDTVLSQCNTVLLHRLSNQRDFEKVSALVPSQLSGFLDFLPALPKQQTLALGAATTIPVLMNIDDLAEEHRPDSKDPNFWKTWTKGPQKSTSYEDLVANWQEE